MKLEWSLREEILAISHRWQYPTLAFLLGCLVGIILSLALPTRYRAEKLLSVSYSADTVEANPTDYKNWQLEQLNALALSPEVIRGTLDKLRRIDSYWSDVNRKELTSMLKVGWRNTGLWRMTAEADTPEHAQQTIQAWSDVLLQNYQQARISAVEFHELDRQLFNLEAQLVQAKARWAVLESASQGLQNWHSQIKSLPPDQLLETLSYWGLWSLASQAAGLDPARKTLLDEAPSTEAPAREFLPWIDRWLTSLESETDLLFAQINELENERTPLQARYAGELQRSRGLSGELEVAASSPSPNALIALRSISLYALVCGILGLLIYTIIWLLRLRAEPASRSKE